MWKDQKDYGKIVTSIALANGQHHIYLHNLCYFCPLCNIMSAFVCILKLVYFLLQGFYNFWSRAYNHYQSLPKKSQVTITTWFLEIRSDSLPNHYKALPITTISIFLLPISKSLLPTKSARRPLIEPLF